MGNHCTACYRGMFEILGWSFCLVGLCSKSESGVLSDNRLKHSAQFAVSGWNSCNLSTHVSCIDCWATLKNHSQACRFYCCSVPMGISMVFTCLVEQYNNEWMGGYVSIFMIRILQKRRTVAHIFPHLFYNSFLMCSTLFHLLRVGI